MIESDQSLDHGHSHCGDPWCFQSNNDVLASDARILDEQTRAKFYDYQLSDSDLYTYTLTILSLSQAFVQDLHRQSLAFSQW